MLERDGAEPARKYTFQESSIPGVVRQRLPLAEIDAAQEEVKIKSNSYRHLFSFYTRPTEELVWRCQTLYLTLYGVETGSGDMAVPKLFYFPNSGSGQLKYLRSRVRPRNWTQSSSMDDMSYSAAFAVLQLGREELKELQLKVITAFVAGLDVFAVLPTGYGKNLCYACLPLLFDHLYQLEDLQRSIVIVVTPLAAIIRPGKSSLVSLFYAIIPP